MPSGRCVEPDLGPMTALSQGGESIVYALDLIPQQLYKRYSQDVRTDRESDLISLIDLPGAMRDEHRDLVIERTAWPQRAVFSEGGALVGVVIPRAPGDFWFSPVRSQIVRPLAELFFPEKIHGRVRWPELDEVTQVLRHVAELVAVLHGYGVVLGDISHANCLFRLDPSPSVYALDCDGYFPPGGDHDRYVQTPDWDDPLCAEPAYASDDYKLALLILRTLHGDWSLRPGRRERSPQPYGVIDSQIAGLLDRAGGEVPVRPRARDLAFALGSTLDLPFPRVDRHESPLIAAMHGDWAEAARLMATQPATAAVARIVNAHQTVSAA